MNLIAVQHLYPDIYLKFFDGYNVSFLNWSSNNLEAILIDMVLIYQYRGLVKTLPSTVSVDVKSVTFGRW